ncbi:bacillithiol biosynthesis cysteine-adding enzyme BshC [Fervidibacillus albus]|uniref:Putative cysteine ligase BshC n=1 Tax=Fervidibacillus albus TaxID=2980026 RepID=A0A9E8LW18_9BACI|nr:bacillithiol biosynthesis cysteine-adding enzyme BshC [Fervidibacillus albus]WAA10624.1 bacillithiol biosynthesis cysteine-adding enzyme BshC [Fervidibacillus albus]
MELSRFFLPYKNDMLNEYVKNRYHSYFHYPFQNNTADIERLRELNRMEFPRKRLSQHIRRYMERFSISEQVEESLRKLEREKSVVVIGGQQAGLLTGPLYTIYKMMTIVLLAKEKEEKLKIPVVPIFWIAGEDHDFDEINHVFVEERSVLKKKTYRDDTIERKRVMSKRRLDHIQLRQWYEEVIRSYGETDFSNQLLFFLHQQLKRADTVTDFFVSISNELFQNYGLLFVDSSHPELRNIESPYFSEIIDKGDEVAKALQMQQRKMGKRGWQRVIRTDENCYHLFFERDGMRHLLYSSENGFVYTENGTTFSKDELLTLAQSSPEQLSNNVVTRPLMQEFLFPTIAFVAGPGELQYWAELKGVFDLFNKRMPPIVPRLHITLLERNLERELAELNLSLQKVLLTGTGEEKKKRIEMLKDQNLHAYFAKGKREIESIYEQLAHQIVQFDKGLTGIVNKNEQFVLSQLQFLEKKVEEAVKNRHSILLKKYDRIENHLHPFGNYQERCWNITYFFNEYGMDFIDRLMQLPFEINGDHYVVKL